MEFTGRGSEAEMAEGYAHVEVGVFVVGDAVEMDVSAFVDTGAPGLGVASRWCQTHHFQRQAEWGDVAFGTDGAEKFVEWFAGSAFGETAHQAVDQCWLVFGFSHDDYGRDLLVVSGARHFESASEPAGAEAEIGALKQEIFGVHGCLTCERGGLAGYDCNGDFAASYYAVGAYSAVGIEHYGFKVRRVACQFGNFVALLRVEILKRAA